MSEFTGERVVPGSVTPDLWNEHVSRYAFAARLAVRKRVLEIGCGTGYGSRALAAKASRVYALDRAPEAIAAFAGADCPSNLIPVQADGTQLPFRDGVFDLVVCFEVIEHLAAWPLLLEEVQRVLAPTGQFMVSTPNKLYYEQSRGPAGANPFHVHEFEFAEFREALQAVFPSLTMFLQNHVQGIAFHPVGVAAVTPTPLTPTDAAPQPDESNFFLAVCAKRAQTGAPAYIYLPSTANLLREREEHIQLLEGELRTKEAWLEQAKREHAELLALHRSQIAELEERAAWARQCEERAEERTAWAHSLEEQVAERTAWAQSLQAALEEKVAHVSLLQDEVAALKNQILETLARHAQETAEQIEAALAAEREGARAAVASYDARLAELHAALEERTQTAQANIDRLEGELAGQTAELGRCVELLHAAERTVEERTLWAQSLDRHIAELEQVLAGLRDSRWLRLGKRIGVGPSLTES